MTTFLELHRPGDPLLMPNPWDVGSARVLAHAGFRALATTSSGFAATLGRPDGGVSRAEALAHAAAVAGAVDVPVSADLENGFADDPDAVAATVRAARDAELAGCSIEDATGRDDDPIYGFAAAVERVEAAVAAAGDVFVLTARAENLIHGRDDAAGFADTIARLQAFQQAGAHVLFAPGLTSLEQVRSVLAEIDRPLSVLTMAGTPSVAELADAGVARISVGGSFAFAAYDALGRAASELLDAGTYGWLPAMRNGRKITDAAFG